MTLLEVPVWDEGIGEYITRRLSIVGCLAHIGDVGQPPQFRLYLTQVAKDGSLIPIGADSIGTEYLEGFIDQAQRLYDVLIAGGKRDWAGNKIDFGRAKING